MKQSGRDLFSFIMGILVIVIGCIGGIMVFDTEETFILGLTSIFCSLVLGAFLLGISKIIYHLAYGNEQREQIISL